MECLGINAQITGDLAAGQPLLGQKPNRFLFELIWITAFVDAS